MKIKKTNPSNLVIPFPSSAMKASDKEVFLIACHYFKELTI
jgi:hypothetical protein